MRVTLEFQIEQLWKTTKNVTAKTLAQSKIWTHLVATSVRMLRRRCQRNGVVSNEATNQRDTGFNTNALSRLST